MLDMGFIRDVRRIVQALPRQRQSLLFSATMPEDVVHLAHEMLNQPVRIDVAPPTMTADRIEQRLFHVGAQDKRKLLVDLLHDPKLARVIVFTRTKHGANKVVEHLEKSGIPADAIHGNKSQNARQKAMENFRSGRARLPGRHRHRGPRRRRRRHHPCHQLRAAQRAGELCPPHRPHRACRHGRHRDLVLCAG